MPILFAVSPLRGDPVGAGDDQVDLAARHQRRGGRVDDHRVRDPGLLELPGGEAGALEQRARLVDEHPLEQPALPGGAERADRGAVAAGGEAARVAVRQRARPGGEELGRVRGHPPAAVDLLGVERPRPLGRRVVAHLRERPGQVDRGRARGAEHALGLGEVLAAERREREPVRRGDADRGRAAHDHRPDRLRDLGRGAAGDLDDLAGELPLVEEDDRRAGLVEPRDLLRLEPAGRVRVSHVR